MAREDEPLLNVGTWHERSWANGPGQRFVLWMQGCPRRCPGCVNPQFLPMVSRHRFSVEELAARILAVRDIEGVTYTGGEPLLQAYGLALLSRRLRSAGKTIVCYTGETLASLRLHDDPWEAELLELIDILIDGPYVRAEAANLLWRGSRNQQVHFLSDVYRHLAPELETRAAEVELMAGCDDFTTTGTWPDGFVERLEERLKSGCL